MIGPRRWLLCLALAGAPAARGTDGAFATGRYPDLFRDWLGKTDAEVDAKLAAAWHQLFYGDDATERVYYPVGADLGYITDVANRDVRTEGMSYGMMIAVQLDHQAEFNRLWKWAKTYMYHADGPYAGYFAWHCAVDGRVLDPGPASDGEEWFATALFFAAHRWGNGAGPFDYDAEAQTLLHTMQHRGDAGGEITSMFDHQARQVVFAPNRFGSGFTDPSYQLPAFYELWARWAKTDGPFWVEAAAASRALFRRAADPRTGLMPDYANFDGTPHPRWGHENFGSDAWRTLANVALDHAWFDADPWQVEQSNRVLAFFARPETDGHNKFALDGRPVSNDRSPGLVAMEAVAGLAADRAVAQPFVQRLWDAPIPTGEYRYYDGLLHFLGLLQVSGHFRIYAPPAP